MNSYIFIFNLVFFLFTFALILTTITGG